MGSAGMGTGMTESFELERAKVVLMRGSLERTEGAAMERGRVILGGRGGVSSLMISM